MPYVPEKVYDALQSLYFQAFGDGQQRERNNAFTAINLAWNELDKLVVEREPCDEGETLEEAERMAAIFDEQEWDSTKSLLPFPRTLTKQEVIELLGECEESRG